MKYSIGVLPVTPFEDDKVHNLIEKWMGFLNGLK